MKKLLSWSPFHKPLAKDIVQATLADYERHLVAEEAAAAYHRKMAEFYKEGIQRLHTYRG